MTLVLSTLYPSRYRAGRNTPVGFEGTCIMTCGIQFASYNTHNKGMISGPAVSCDISSFTSYII